MPNTRVFRITETVYVQDPEKFDRAYKRARKCQPELTEKDFVAQVLVEDWDFTRIGLFYGTDHIEETWEQR